MKYIHCVCHDLGCHCARHSLLLFVKRFVSHFTFIFHLNNSPPRQGATPTSAMSTATGAGQRPSLYDQLKLNMKTTSLFDMVKNFAQMKREMSKITSGMDDLARAQGFCR